MMRVDASKLEKNLKSMGVGSWNRLEFVNNSVVLRVASVKQAEGRVQIFFDGQRDQVVSHGRLYSPMTSHRPYYFRAGVSYLITTQVNLVKPLPADIEGNIVGNSHLAILGGIITSSAIREEGVVEFSLYCTRKAEIDEMVTLCDLVFENVAVAKSKTSAKGGRKKAPAEDVKGKNKFKGGNGEDITKDKSTTISEE